jgi:hypothetical protein
MSEEFEYPKRIGGPPIVLIPIKNNEGIWACPNARHQSSELFALKIVSSNRIVKISGPIDFVSSGDMSGWVKKGVLVRLNDDYLRVV